MIVSYKQLQNKFSNQYPAIDDLFAKAKKRIPPVAWAYMSSGTGDEDLLERNKVAFKK